MAPREHADRPRLVVAAILVLLVAYLVLVHWWFSAPMLKMGGEIRAMREQEQALRLEAAQRSQLQLRLAQVRQFEASNPGFLPEASRELASAGLVQRLQQVVASASPIPASCQITAQTPTDMPTQEPFARVMVQVRLRCGMGEFAAVLHALESGSPQLFIDNLDMLSRRSYLVAGGESGGAIDISFDLYGYLKSANGSKPRG